METVDDYLQPTDVFWHLHVKACSHYSSHAITSKHVHVDADAQVIKQV